MSIRIRKLDDGYLVTDDRGPRIWEGAAVSMADAEIMAEGRLNPRLPSPPPGPGQSNSGYAEDAPTHPLAERQFEQATGASGRCVGSLCELD